jgi:hypothetical protein
VKKLLNSPSAAKSKGGRPKKAIHLTEDEADAIVSYRRLKQKRHGLREVMQQAGYAMDRRVRR